MINVGIVGISGYTGEELLKILSRHKSVEIKTLCGRQDSPIRKLKEFYPQFSHLDMVVQPLNIKELSKSCNIVFLALPYGASFPIVEQLLEAGIKVIDLSADFRLKDAQVYECWYKTKHNAQKYLSEAAYGLPELNFEEIKKARLIANPGCYPTCVLLGLAPILNSGLVDLNNIIIDSQSGVSGAGRKAAKDYFDNEHPNAKAYKAGGSHRHILEIEQELTRLSGLKTIIELTPHIIPMERGMLSTIYLNLKKKIGIAQIIEEYKKFYANQPFIKICGENVLCSTKGVVNTNFCEISFAINERTNRLIIFSVIDNLIKGASGQAVQNMNILFGLPQESFLI